LVQLTYMIRYLQIHQRNALRKCIFFKTSGNF